MSRTTAVFIIVTVAAVLCSVNGQRTPMGRIPGIPCTEAEIASMFGKCMIKFTKGHGVEVITKMRKMLTCDTSLLKCEAVMDARVCLSNLPLSDQCKLQIDAVSNHQFEVFQIPCRISHLKSTCMGLFTRNGLTKF